MLLFFMNSLRSNRQQQLQAYANIHKRPTFRGPQYSQQRKPASVASSSVYDPDESVNRNVKISFKQAITLITLRLGRLEVFANENKLGNKMPGDSIDKDFLMTLVTRIENMEKTLHNLRVESEKNRLMMDSLNETLENNIDIQEEPIILEITEKLDSLVNFIEGLKDLQDEPAVKEIEPAEKTEELIQDNIQDKPIQDKPIQDKPIQDKPIQDNLQENEILPPALVYNPNVIEPYKLTEPTTEPTNPITEIKPTEIKPTEIKATEPAKKKRGKKVVI